MRCLVVFAGLSGVLVAAAANAQDMVDLIPPAALAESSLLEQAPVPGESKQALELIAVAQSWRQADEGIVVSSPAALPDWSWQARLNSQGRHKLPSLDLHWNTSLEAIGNQEESLNLSSNLRWHVKEAYLMWQDGTWAAEAGRVNIRTGVASGFHPTDFYRSNTAISSTTADAGSQRDDRLGTLAGRITTFFNQGVWSLAVSPQVAGSASSFWGQEDVVGWQFNRSNTLPRLTLTGSEQMLTGIHAEALAHVEDSHPAFGFNLSQGMGKKWLLHAEGALSYRRRLLEQAGLARQSERQWLGQLVAGAGYTTEMNMTNIVELHYNDAGLSEEEQQNWMSCDTGPPGGNCPAVQLLAVRQLARDRQEPLSRLQLFFRSQIPEILHPDLSLTALALLNPYDESILSQIESSLVIDGATVLTLRLMATIGDAASEHGGKRGEYLVLLRLQQYF